MTVRMAEAIILQTGIKIALQHRFAFDTGTILRLENDAMVNVFDDGRYYIQGDNREALIAAFGRVEAAWDPNTWDGKKPKAALSSPPETTQPCLPSADENARFDF